MELSLQYYSNNEKVIKAVAMQFEKDVMLSGGQWEWSGNINADALLEEVKAFLVSVSIKNTTLLFNLLYRIDVPQQLIELNADELANEVMKRELIKVLMRKGG